MQKKADKELLENLSLLYRGFIEVYERAKKVALEQKLDPEKLAGMDPDEFIKLAAEYKGELPAKYEAEMKRYNDMIISKISQALNVDLKGKIVKTLGLPNAPRNRFVVEKNGKKYEIIIDRENGVVELKLLE